MRSSQSGWGCKGSLALDTITATRFQRELPVLSQAQVQAHIFLLHPRPHLHQRYFLYLIPSMYLLFHLLFCLLFHLLLFSLLSSPQHPKKWKNAEVVSWLAREEHDKLSEIAAGEDWNGMSLFALFSVRLDPVAYKNDCVTLGITTGALQVQFKGILVDLFQETL